MLKTGFMEIARGFTLIELMIATAIISIMASIAIPNFISYRNKAFCTQTERDAANLAAAIADYFGNPSRVHTPAITDLKTSILNPAEIIGADPNENITIRVTDRTGRCPVEYQNALEGWDGNYVFTKTISY